MSEGAIGIIETRGVVALAAGIEAMMKTADVQTIAVERISSGYLAAAVRGSLAAVRQAVAAGSQAVRAVRRAARGPGVPEAARRLRGAAGQNGSADRLARAIEAAP